MLQRLTAENFCRGSYVRENTRCFLGWMKVQEDLFVQNINQRLLFIELAKKTAKEMNLADAKTGLISQINNHPDNTEEQLAEW